ncbi:hypothetical protein [Rhizobium sp. CSW-27]|uniref:hypothetical protein n=1 Tax=Rhizobium sp. CSW-27 TaxID=2839985 RepID=UPI001C038AEB|nr:hypothetical protein [Rhizobium sp. CSW-27]MBT9371561.1 hypothetical protein [Rhizobium sp. CSW-27]
MLPPVAALSDTSFDLSGQPGQMPALPRIELSLGRADADPQSPATAAPGASRFGLLSLSGQMQLSQGLSVVAETIGALLKINRNAGESLADYSDRIAEAISALSGPEKLALQRALNQLMQGFTLRLLTDILKNPFGPEATRVALQIEAAAYHERDPATRRVVTSYWQNAGADAAQGPIGPQAAAAGDARRLPGEWLRSGATGEGRALTSPLMQGRPEGASAFPVRPEHDEPAPLTEAGRHSGDNRDLASGPAALTGTVSRGDIASATGLPPAATTGFTAAPAADIAPMRAATPLAMAGKASEPPAAEASAAPSLPATQETAASLAGEDATYDGPALARRMTGPEEAMDHAAALPRPGLPTAGDVPVPVAAAWLSGLYADEGGTSWPLTHVLADAAADPQPTATGPEPDSARDAAADPRTADAAGEASSSTATAGERGAPAAPSSQTGAAPAQATPGQPPSAPSPAVGAPRDAVLPAYVPYGPQGMPEDEEMPLVRAVDGDDEDRQHGRRRGGQPQRDTAEDEVPRQAEDAGEDGPEAKVAEPGPFDAEEASLPPAPAEDSAQGFYQRLAAW